MLGKPSFVLVNPTLIIIVYSLYFPLVSVLESSGGTQRAKDLFVFMTKLNQCDVKRFMK